MRPLLSTIALVAPSAWAMSTSGRERYGLIGYGISMYDPPCAFACIDTVNGWALQCDDDHGMDDDMGSMHIAAATPECKATNDMFLETMAWCFYTHCPEAKNSTLEAVWETDIVGRLKTQPSPKYSYQVALSSVSASPPKSILDSMAVLNKTSLVDEDVWLSNFNADDIFEKMEIVTEKYGIILMATCVAIPIALSCLRFLPIPQSIISRFYTTFIDPPLFGSYHAVPVLGLGFIPTRGQGLFIAYIWVINIILSSVGYELRDPMSWYSSVEQQLLAYISNRVGILSFVNLALAVLFSSRNSLLLWVTDWFYSTFLLLHRWIAVICMLQACLHSAIYLQIYLDPAKGEGAYEKEAKEDYWVWGIKLYEAFLASHVVLALLSMIGCMLHIFYRYEWQWGYQTWIWITFAFWIFDRMLARPMRVLKHGVKRAIITVIDEDYLQITIPGVQAEGHVYLYFPTLTWRVWENHPFSVAAVSTRPVGPHKTRSQLSRENESLEEKNVTNVTDLEQYSSETNVSGLVILVRRHGGLTSLLSASRNSTAGIPVLIEGSYGHQPILASSIASPDIEYPNVVCVAGGVGISGVLSYLNQSPSALGLGGKKKLLWGVRTEPLVEAVRTIIPRVGFAADGQETWNDFDVSISVGRRIDLKKALTKELGSAVCGTTIVVCGPAGMADEVRATVTELGTGGVVVRLVEESFVW
ncbi:hypothetical protein KAF25_004057 [Fusarium avenaceum]|uniref:FAD-binding FR-type domain-containing protein n=1 Tax=Fusarium avenaceum TaxID=40199 RepID=A0A9P7H8I9_9HYPO|nr:hypothetical protein KAF25_004057 [Fusarium avenaceum]